MKKNVAIAIFIGLVAVAHAAQQQPKQAVAHAAPVHQQQTVQPIAPQPIVFKREAELTKLLARKGGFGTVLMIDKATIKNTSSRTLKDFRIVCDHYGKSNTYIGTSRATIYDTVKPGTSKTFSNISAGFIHSQGAQISCILTEWR